MRNKKVNPIQNDKFINSNENNIPKNKNRTHKSRHRRRPIANWNKSNLTRIFPTNVPQLLYRRRNGRTKFEQAVKKRRVINYLVGISGGIIVTSILTLVVTIVILFMIRFVNSNSSSSKSSSAYISTDATQINSLFYQIVNNAVLTNSSLYLSFINYKTTSSSSSSGNTGRRKRDLNQNTAYEYIFESNLENMINSLNWNNKGYYINGKQVSILSYVDNVAVISTNYDDLKTMLIDLYDKSLINNLDINLNLTKW
jgi:hypothetical protein